MIGALRRRLSGQDRDRGLSLIEIIVASGVSLLVLTMVSSLFIQVATVTTNSTQTRNSTTVASTAASEITRVVRLATRVTMTVSGKPQAVPALVAGTANKLTIYSYVDTTSANPAPSMITFDGSSGQLTETRCVGTQAGGVWSFAGCKPTTRNLGGSIIAPTGTEANLFQYLGQTSNVIPLVSGQLPPANYDSVASVAVSLKIQAAGSTTAPVYLTSNVGMPNVGIDQKAS